jgi:hypothetical protein
MVVSVGTLFFSVREYRENLVVNDFECGGGNRCAPILVGSYVTLWRMLVSLNCRLWLILAAQLRPKTENICINRESSRNRQRANVI